MPLGRGFLNFTPYLSPINSNITNKKIKEKTL